MRYPCVRSVWLATVCVLALFSSPAGAEPLSRETNGGAALPLTFVENRGQFDPDVVIGSIGGGYGARFTAAGLRVLLDRGALSLRFAHAREGAVPQPRGDASGLVSYIRGSESAGTRAIPAYTGVVYHDVWPFIDVSFTTERGMLKYAVLIRPGGDLRDVAFDYGSAFLTAQGDALHIRTPEGDRLRDEPPTAVQQTRDGPRAVDIGLTINPDGHTLGFETPGGYAVDSPLLIDPGLVYETFIGGASGDTQADVAVDPAGNVYVAGTVTSAAVAATAGVVQTTFAGGGSDAYVAKLTPDGSRLLYATFLGGSGADEAGSLAVDAGGNAYLLGRTSSADFPVTSAAYSRALRGRTDAFVAKLDPAGSFLVYSTFLGGSGDEDAPLTSSIAVDAAGQAVVGGNTFSSDFPTTAGSYRRTWAAPVSIYVTKLLPSGSGLVASTFAPLSAYGGTGPNGSVLTNRVSVDVDGQGDIYVAAGRSIDKMSLDLAAVRWGLGASGTVSGISMDRQAGQLAIVDNTCSSACAMTVRLVAGADGWGLSSWNLTSEGSASGIVASGGEVFIAGTTHTATFPVTAGALEPQFPSGSTDAGFLLRLASGSQGYVYATFLSHVVPTAIALDARDGETDVVLLGPARPGATATPGALQLTPASDVLMTIVPEADRATFAPASASSTESSGLDASRVVDGDFTTRWSSQFSDPQWLAVDLGRSVDLRRVLVHWETADASTYEVQGSSDGSTWTTLRTVTSDGQIDDVRQLGGVPVRYVRIRGLTRATPWGYSIFEVSVFGAASQVNQPPSLTITSPVDRAVYYSPVNIPISVSATDVDGTVTRVDFFAQGKFIGSDTSAPFGMVFSFSTAIAELVEITARAYDDQGAVSVNNPWVTVTVNGAIDYAHGALTSASSVENAGYGPQFAVDGSSSTRWASTWADNQWWQVDLGRQIAITSMRLDWEAAYADQYQVLLSTDGTTFWTGATVTTGRGGREYLAINQTARYVRVLGVHRATPYGISLWEVAVLGSPATTTALPNLALGRPASASSVENNAPGFAPILAVDGATTTRWSSAFADNQSITVDLQRYVRVLRIELQWEAAYADGYQVQVSLDNQTWQTVYATTSGDGGLDVLPFDITARFVRILGVHRATPWGISLWEIAIFGS